MGFVGGLHCYWDYFVNPIYESIPFVRQKEYINNTKSNMQMVLTQAKVRAFHKEANEELLKFLRLERAFVFFIFWVGMFALLKTIAFWLIKGHYQRKLIKLEENKPVELGKFYLWFIDFKRYEKSRVYKIIKIKEKKEIAHNIKFEDYTEDNSIMATKEYVLHKLQTGLYGHLVSFIVSVILYAISIKYWYEIALFYHLNIMGIYVSSN
jgi:hypothetical protein